MCIPVMNSAKCSGHTDGRVTTINILAEADITNIYTKHFTTVLLIISDQYIICPETSKKSSNKLPGGNVYDIAYPGFPHILKNLEIYGCPGMSWKSPGKTQFFRLSWNSGILIKMSCKSPGILWSMEFGFLWQFSSDHFAIFLMFYALYRSLKNWNSERGHMNK